MMNGIACEMRLICCNELETDIILLGRKAKALSIEVS
jgi:hypothetical protein